MTEYGISDLLVESEFIWREIAVGDRVMIEADIYEPDGLKLKSEHSHLVLAKLRHQPGSSSLVVQSDVTGELISLHPALICSYETNGRPVIYS